MKETIICIGYTLGIVSLMPIFILESIINEVK
jgi:hypothetical protein